MKTLDWSQLKDRPYSIGRNGLIKTSGLEIYSSDKFIHISPITSKGMTANCIITIPKSELHNLIKILKSL